MFSLRRGTLRSLQVVNRRTTSRILAQARFLSSYQDVTTLRSSLLDNVRARNITEIHASYPALVAQLKETGVPSTSNLTSPIARPDILNLLEVLASSGRPSELQRISDILHDLKPVFGIVPDVEVHTTIIRGLIKTGNIQKVSEWLGTMTTKPGHVTPTLDQYHLVLETFTDVESLKSIRFFVRNMRAAGCPPNNTTYTYLLHSARRKQQEDGKPLSIVVTRILDDMRSDKLPFDSRIEAFLQDNFQSAGSRKIREMYRAYFDEQPLEVQFNLTTKLSHVARQAGFRAAVDLLKSHLHGEKPAISSLRSTLRNSLEKEHLLVIQKEFGVEPTVDLWSLIVVNNIRAGLFDEALTLYKESKAAGIVPDAGLVDPLIRALCSTTPPASISSPLDLALSLFDDLKRVSPLTSSNGESTISQATRGPDAVIYHDLLRGLARSTDLKKYFPVAREILDDMEARGVSNKDSHTASSIIVLLMRCAPSTQDALDVYYSMRSSLDEKGYAIVLNAFCNLRPNGVPTIPSLQDYFAIVKDMRDAGLEITPEVYTILLKQLALVAVQLKRTDRESWQNMRDTFVLTTRRAHDFLTLDAAVSPDAPVWNQLMDTYQRMNCFGDAYRVWETMYLSGRFDHISVSNILDACGFSRSWPIAKKVTSQLFRDRFSFNLHNWNSWIECLCRLGRFDDAIRVVCFEMGKGNNTIKPDVESFRILIKFARRDGVYTAVADRLRQHIPDAWEGLPEELRTPLDPRRDQQNMISR